MRDRRTSPPKLCGEPGSATSSIRPTPRDACRSTSIASTRAIRQSCAPERHTPRSHAMHRSLIDFSRPLVLLAAALSLAIPAAAQPAGAAAKKAAQKAFQERAAQLKELDAF